MTLRFLRRRALALGLLAALCTFVAACGSSSKSSSSSSSSSGASSSSAKPGAGKPTIILGDKNFDEEFLLGDLYQQALQAKGFTVKLKPNIGSSELIYKALTGGQINVYPEYTGTLLTAIAGDDKPPSSAAQTFQLADAYLKKHGFEFLNQTPFYDADGMAVLTSYAKAHNLKTIADLKKLGKVTYGAPAENRTRYDGLVGLEKLYGLHNLSFVPLAEGLNYKALDDKQVSVATIFTSDPQLKNPKYTVLTDTKKLFGFQNVAPVVKASLVKAEGPAFAQTLNKVSSLLTLPAIIKMNAAVQLDQVSPAKVAKSFLAANGLG